MAAEPQARRWADRYPELGTGPVPIEPCVSSTYFERERERVFRRAWLNVAREDELPAGGDYVVAELPVARTSVLVARGKDGRVRAFHNMCPHRSNKVVRGSGGHANGFVCGFHGWAFDLTGRLIRATDREGFFDFDEASCGLTPIAADVWEGFVFVNLDSSPRWSLGEYLGAWGETLAGYPFADMRLRDHYRAEVAVNWKVALDAFQETWHARFVHKRSGGEAYASRENPYIHVLDFALYQYHRSMSVPGNAAFVPTPAQICAHQFGKSYIKRERSDASLPSGVNPTRSPIWMFDANFVFPNFAIFVFDGMYFTYHFWPLAHDRTLWETKTYYPEAENAGQRFSQEYAKCALRDTWLEDLSTLEDIQAVLASGARDHFILQDQEILIRHSHKVVGEFVADDGSSRL